MKQKKLTPEQIYKIDETIRELRTGKPAWFYGTKYQVFGSEDTEDLEYNISGVGIYYGFSEWEYLETMFEEELLGIE